MKPKIVIYGGSFDPIHCGHLEVIKSLLTRKVNDYDYYYDQVWVMVTPQNPLKEHEAADQWDRYCMCRRAIRASDLPRKEKVVVSYFQFLMSDCTTYSLLERLDTIYPEYTFEIAIDSDCLLDITKWYKWQTMLARWPMYVIPRANNLPTSQDMNFLREHPAITMGNPIFENTSSSEIREAFQKYGEKGYFLGLVSKLPKVMFDYIKGMKLYGCT